MGARLKKATAISSVAGLAGALGAVALAQPAYAVDETCYGNAPHPTLNSQNVVNATGTVGCSYPATSIDTDIEIMARVHGSGKPFEEIPGGSHAQYNVTYNTGGASVSWAVNCLSGQYDYRTFVGVDDHDRPAIQGYNYSTAITFSCK